MQRVGQAGTEPEPLALPGEDMDKIYWIVRNDNWYVVTPRTDRQCLSLSHSRCNTYHFSTPEDAHKCVIYANSLRLNNFRVTKVTVKKRKETNSRDFSEALRSKGKVSRPLWAYLSLWLPIQGTIPATDWATPPGDHD